MDSQVSLPQKLQETIQALISSSNESELEDAVRSIRNFLEGSNGFKLLQQPELKPLLYQGLQHPNADVQVLVISQIQRLAENLDTVKTLDDPILWDIFIKLLSGNNIGAAEKISNIIRLLGKSPEGLHIIFQKSVLDELLKLSHSTNEIIKFRVLDLFASLSSLSIQAFQLTEANSCLQEVIQTIQTNDLLQLLNVFELFEKIAKIHEGATYLEQNNVFKRAIAILSSDDPFGSMLFPRIILFFGRIAEYGDLETQIVERSGFLPHLEKQILQDDNLELKEASIASVGSIGSQPRGLLLLNTTKILKEFFFSVNVEQLRISFLHSFAHLLKSIKKTSTVDTDKLLQQLVTEAPTRSGGSDNLLNIVMPYLLQPFPELRYAIFDLLVGLAKHEWGLSLELQYPGFFEFCLNRTTETSKVGKEWKYNLVQSVVETAKSHSNLLEKVKLNELIKYLKQGPFWVDAEAAMEIETGAV